MEPIVIEPHPASRKYVEARALELADLEVFGRRLALLAQPFAERLIDGFAAGVAGFLERARRGGTRVPKEDRAQGSERRAAHRDHAVVGQID